MSLITLDFINIAKFETTMGVIDRTYTLSLYKDQRPTIYAFDTYFKHSRS